MTEPERTLADAVRDYLDEMEHADMQGDRIPWPQELEEMTGWEPKEES